MFADACQMNANVSAAMAMHNRRPCSPKKGYVCRDF